MLHFVFMCLDLTTAKLVDRNVHLTYFFPNFAGRQNLSERDDDSFFFSMLIKFCLTKSSTDIVLAVVGRFEWIPTRDHEVQTCFRSLHHNSVIARFCFSFPLWYWSKVPNDGHLISWLNCRRLNELRKQHRLHQSCRAGSAVEPPFGR